MSTSCTEGMSGQTTVAKCRWQLIWLLGTASTAPLYMWACVCMCVLGLGWWGYDDVRPGQVYLNRKTDRQAAGWLASAATRLSRHTTRRGVAYRCTHTVYTQWALSLSHHAPAASVMWNIHTGTKGKETDRGGEKTWEVRMEENVIKSGAQMEGVTWIIT